MTFQEYVVILYSSTIAPRESLERNSYIYSYIYVTARISNRFPVIVKTSIFQGINIKADICQQLIR